MKYISTLIILIIYSCNNSISNSSDIKNTTNKRDTILYIPFECKLINKDTLKYISIPNLNEEDTIIINKNLQRIISTYNKKYNIKFTDIIMQTILVKIKKVIIYIEINYLFSEKNI